MNNNFSDLRIYSCCYINDEVNFYKMYNLIFSNNCNKNFSGMKARDFIKYIKNEELLIEVPLGFFLNDTIRLFNKLFEHVNIELVLTKDMFDDLKSLYSNLNDNLSSYLNIITLIVRRYNYELVQIYPIDMNVKKMKYYFIVVGIDKLLELNEVGYME